MYYSFHLTTVTWTLLGAALVCFAIVAIWQVLKARRLELFVQHDETSRDHLADDELPSVSVIVDAEGETGQLTKFLPLVLHQDYPAPMEVIVVADGSAESTGDLLSEMKAAFPNLHITFTPSDTRSLSRKKLALMIGIKAARHEVVLTTSANCRVTSDQWLRTMLRNFTDGTDVVLGYSHYRYKQDRKAGRRWRVFDTVSTGAQWLLSAIGGHPYRGVSDNLAYRRQLFFDNNGFARSMNLRWGDDDVFVAEIARPDNTRVELAPDSQVTVYYDNLARTHRVLKMRRDFTARLGRQAPRLLQAVMSLLWLLAHLAAITAIALNATNVVVVVAAVVMVLAAWGVVAWGVGRQCRVLQAPVLRLSAPLLMLWRPVVNSIYRLRETRTRKSNYTTYL
ncbi:MAG: glycosyltransferase [Muribaculaceae bacterium]|nr:glycosyltransferase [Muribaculaceae bacterium]